MQDEPQTVLYGDWNVPILERDWKAHPIRMPYRKTFRLRPGESWTEAETAEKIWETYALRDDGLAVPVGALIAGELMATGAKEAVFTELFGGRFVMVNAELVCVPFSGELYDLIGMLRKARGESLGGLPDVIAIFQDGRVAMREAKNVASKDRIGKNQHEFARTAQKELGARLDLAIVQWGRTR